MKVINSVGSMKHKDRGIQMAVLACGSYAELCRRLRLSTGATHRWKKVPARQVVAVEKATGIDRSRLRPDLYRV